MYMCVLTAQESDEPICTARTGERLEFTRRVVAVLRHTALQPGRSRALSIGVCHHEHAESRQQGRSSHPTQISHAGSRGFKDGHSE